MSEYLFEHLWTASWQICILGIVVYFVCRLFSKSPQLRYWLWFIVLLRLFIPNDIVPFQEHVPQEIRVTIPSSSIVVAPVTNEIFADDQPSLIPINTAPEISWRLWLITFWAMGVLLLLMHLVYKLQQIFSEIKRCDEVTDPGIQHLLNGISEELDIHTRVKIYSYHSSSVFHGPCLFGILQPRILLPQKIVSHFSPEELKPILVHELTHIQQRDLLMSCVQTMAQILYFFHPGIWYINGKINQEREFVCDDLSIKSLGHMPTSYAKTLVNSVQMVSVKPMTTFFVVCLAEKQSFLRRRVQRMIQSDYAFPAKRWWHFALIAVVTAFSFSILAGQASLQLGISTKGSEDLVLYQEKPYLIHLQNSSNKALKSIRLEGAFSKNIHIRKMAPSGILENGKVVLEVPEVPAGDEYIVELYTLGVSSGPAKLEFQATLENQTIRTNKNFLVDGLPAIHIHSYDTEDPVVVGQETTYVVEIRNEGTKYCKNVRLVNYVSEKMDFAGADVPNSILYKYDHSSRQIVFDPIPRIEPGEKISYRIRCKALMGGIVKNKAIFTSDSFTTPVVDEELTKLRDGTKRAPAMHMSCYDTEDPVEVGRETTYVVEMRNEGDGLYEDATLVVELSEELSFVNSSTEFEIRDNKIIFTQPRTVEPGQKIVWKLKCRAGKAGMGKMKATIIQGPESVVSEEITRVY